MLVRLLPLWCGAKSFSYIYPESLQDLEESNVLGHMAYNESGGLYYWLIPLFALSGSLDYFMYMSTAGHILWITFVIYKTFKGKSAAQKHPTETTVQEEKGTLEWLYRFDEFVAEDYVAPVSGKIYECKLADLLHSGSYYFRRIPWKHWTLGNWCRSLLYW